MGETKAEREKWQQKRAILERAHIKDMIELQEQQAELREDDMINFRAVLKEEHDKLKMVEDAWKGLLAGTHDAQLSYNTQRLSTVENPPLPLDSSTRPSCILFFRLHVLG